MTSRSSNADLLQRETSMNAIYFVNDTICCAVINIFASAGGVPTVIHIVLNRFARVGGTLTAASSVWLRSVPRASK